MPFDTDFAIGADYFLFSMPRYMSRPALPLPSRVTIWSAAIRHTNFDEMSFHLVREIWERNLRFGYRRATHEDVMIWPICSLLNDVIMRPLAPNLGRMFGQFLPLVLRVLRAIESEHHLHCLEMKRV